jgi:stage II sporulation protein D
MVRRALCLLVLPLALAAAASARAPAVLPPPVVKAAFVISGHGYGHGVGLSQYGAFGYAQHGWTYDRILAHYYPGTTLGPAPLSDLRVLVAEGKAALTVASPVPFRVKDAAGKAYPLQPGAYKLGPALALALGPDAAPTALAGPLTFLPGRQPLALDGRAYRGALRIVVTGRKVNAVDLIGLERYLWGVVSAEMPHDWPAEALKAQAIAARSYALASRAPAGNFDLYGDIRSQAYLGVAGETPEGNAAVTATAGRVVLYGGKVATTFFFSSSGGVTADVQDVFQGSTPIPYLVSVSDPYDTVSPWHDWGPVVVPVERAAKLLKVPGLSDLAPDSTVDRAHTVTATGAAGPLALRASAVRFALGLRSTWFTVGVLGLAHPPGALVYGGSWRLTATVRGVDGAELQQLVSGAWQPVATTAPAPDGSFSAVVRPLAGTRFRLAAGETIGPVVVVPVAPRVTLAAQPDGGVAGTVTPVTPGVAVDVQRLGDDGSTWTTVTTSIVDPSGSFTAALASVSGTYRARIAAGRGLAAGVSPSLRVGS